MRRFVVVAGLSLVSCGRGGIQTTQVAITDPPPLVAASGSHLAVPASCPIFTDSVSQIDPHEPPFPGCIKAMCAVDEAGHSFGLVPGEAPGGGGMAIVPGSQEIGIYIGFDVSPAPLPTIDLDADPPSFEAWAAATNIESQDCCADTHPDKRVPVTLVAAGEHGVLFSVGRYDAAPIQVAWMSQPDGGPIFDYARFYVNGAPGGGDPTVTTNP